MIRSGISTFLTRVACIGIGFALFGVSAIADPVAVELPAQPLASALREFARQTGIQVAVPAELTDGQTSAAIKGSFEPVDALNKLLKGSGLIAYPVNRNTYGIRRETDAGKPQVGINRPISSNATSDPSVRTAQAIPTGPDTIDEDDRSTADRKSAKNSGLNEIVVTGTYLHDVEPLSTLITITHDDIINQGYSRLDQVFSQLPENSMAGASAESNPTNGLGDNASKNYSRGSGVNLFGLGANATLVLLNGERMAMSNFGQSVDISLIPVSIIDRVEILSDGASAIYGADAVGGVVNIITRNDYSGTEVGARTASISAGKAPNFGGDILHGFSWSGG